MRRHSSKSGYHTMPHPHATQRQHSHPPVQQVHYCCQCHPHATLRRHYPAHDPASAHLYTQHEPAAHMYNPHDGATHFLPPGVAGVGMHPRLEVLTQHQHGRHGSASGYISVCVCACTVVCMSCGLYVLLLG